MVAVFQWLNDILSEGRLTYIHTDVFEVLSAAVWGTCARQLSQK